MLLGIQVRVSENDEANMLKTMELENPTEQQKKDVRKMAIEEHHTILFLLGADIYKYGKLFKNMKNEVVQREDSFPKTPPEDFHVVSKFKTNMG